MRILFSFLILFTVRTAHAQNTNPWPATGSVGIGTTTPLTPLHVLGNITVENKIIGDVSHATLVLSNTQGSVLTWGTGVNASSIGCGGPVTLNTNSLERMRVTQTGHIGIGTSSPSASLEIFSANAAFAHGYTSNLRLKSNAPAIQYWDDNHANGWQIGAEGGSLYFGSLVSLTAENYRVTFLANGSVGIGTTTPSAQLHTSGSVRFQGLTNNDTYTQILASDANGNLAWRNATTLGSGGSSTSWGQGGTAVTAEAAIGTTSGFDLPIVTGGTERMRVSANGSVGIATPAAQIGTAYKLYVGGNIRARKMRVDADTWPDYVFQKSFALPSLREVEKFIQQHSHLPGVPSAKEVQEKGLDVAETQAILLKKIEELTLYVISLQKEVEGLKKDRAR